MAAARRPCMPPSSRASGTPSMAERRRPASIGTAAARPGPRRAAWPARRALELSRWRNAKGGEERSGAEAGRGLWEAGQPTAAAALLARCLAAGVVSQVAARRGPRWSGGGGNNGETLDLTCRKAPCFVKFSEMEKMANIQAEINEKKLKTEILQLEKETADIAHPFYLGKKCEILQDMNKHLEAVLKEKRALRKRLIKPRCQESLPIEATFHKYVVELLTEAVTFIEKLESHLQTVRSIPQIPNIMKNMVSSKRTEPSVSFSIKNSMLFGCPPRLTECIEMKSNSFLLQNTALTKTEVLVIELEELAEQILKWRELQKEVYSDSICNTAELDFGLSLT